MNNKLYINNKSSYEYITKVFPGIKKFTEILKYINIKDFGYLKIYRDGSYLHLASNLEHTQSFLSEVSEQGDFFTTVISRVAQSVLKYSILPNNITLFDKSKDKAVHLLHRFNMWNTLSVYNISTEFLECHYFSPYCEAKYVQLFYVQNMHLINHFIEYFNSTAGDLIDTKDRTKLAKFDQQFVFQEQQDFFVPNDEIAKFLTQTEYKYTFPINNSLITLSEKELGCLYYLSKGFSSKQIAHKVGNLSPRTIEGRIAHIKDKAGVYFTSQLVSELMNNKKLQESYEIVQLKQKLVF